MEKIGWTDRVKNGEVLCGVEKKKIPNTIKTTKAKRIGCTFSWNCLQKHFTEGEIERLIEVTERRGRRRTQLLNNIRETRELWKL